MWIVTVIVNADDFKTDEAKANWDEIGLHRRELQLLDGDGEALPDFHLFVDAPAFLAFTEGIGTTTIKRKWNQQEHAQSYADCVIQFAPNAVVTVEQDPA